MATDRGARARGDDGQLARCALVARAASLRRRPRRPRRRSRTPSPSACSPAPAATARKGRAAPDGYYPRIAGKPAGYLFNQLRNFRDGRRHYELMNGLLALLDDAYLHEIADHFASLDLPYPPPLAPAALGGAARGRRGARAPRRSGARPAGVQRLPRRADDRPRAVRSRACSACRATTSTRSSAPGATASGARCRPTAWRRSRSGCRPRTSARSRPGSRRSRCPRTRAAPPAPPTPLPIACGGVPPRPAPRAARRDEARARRRSRWPSSRRSCCSRRSPSSGSIATTTSSARPTPPRATDATPSSSRAASTWFAPATATAATPSRGGAPYAGGRAIETPFGIVYAPNLTPDPRPASAAWSSDDFWRALHNGRSRDGRLLYPGVPVSELHPPDARRCRRDVRVPAEPARRSRKPNRPHALALSVRPAGGAGGLARALLSARRAFETDSAQIAAVEPRRLPGRGARPLQRLPLAPQRLRRDARARSISPAG